MYDYRIISSFFIIIVLLSSMSASTIANTYPSLQNISLKDNGYVTIVIDPREIPELIGARADSLTAKIFNGTTWIDLEVYIWNGTKTVFFSGSSIQMPQYGRRITKDTRIIVKAPKNIKNIYTKIWSLDTALKRLHYRAIIYYEDDQRRTNSFYLFYDYEYSGLKQNTLLYKTYNENLLKETVKITKSVVEHSRSFIIDPEKYRIIDQNITYKEYLEKLDKYKVMIGEPPWYIDGGGGTQPTQPPREEEFFHIHLTNDTIIDQSIGPKTFNAYFGACIYDAKLYLYLKNLEDNSGSLIDVTIDEIYTGISTPLNSKTVSIYIPPGEALYREIPLSDLGLITYTCGDNYFSGYYRYKVTFKSIMGKTKIITAYFGLVKDLTGGEDDGPTPEMKYVKYGWEIVDDVAGAFTKDYSVKLDSDEAILFTTPVINGFYYPKNNELDEDAGLSIAFEYSSNNEENFQILINNVPLYTTTLDPTDDELGVMVFWIPISWFKDIVASATYNGEGLIVSIKSSLLQKEGTYISIHEAVLKLPVHPELWRPRSERFIWEPYLMSTSTLYAYRTNGVELTGDAGISFSSVDYTVMQEGNKSYRTSILDVIASGVKYYGNNNVKYYVGGVEAEILFSKNFFDEKSITDKADYSAYIDGKEQTNKKINKYVDYVKTAYYIADIIMLLKEFSETISQTSERQSDISENGFAINLVLFIINAWVDLIKSTKAEINIELVENNTYKGIRITWCSNGFLAKYVRIRIKKVPELASSVNSDGTVIIVIKLYTESDNALTGSGGLTVVIPIKHGEVRPSYMEPITLAGQRPYK